ncbi:hypothetical protein Dda_7597 [Drechslerella dactyloides]|uniref:PPM-type phosphatase domain-containing protein n=1 Tax=Drechslerella dactyloides TaxID=74499 RepID=A0AAD6ISG7_DREDA|nr:hypothetical protein Dda_7597 [Drechslerella dactyloides]
MPVTTRRRSSHLQTSPSTAATAATYPDVIDFTTLQPTLSLSPSSSPSSKSIVAITPSEATRILNERAFDAAPPAASRLRKAQLASLPAHEENEDAYAYEFVPDPLSRRAHDKSAGTTTGTFYWSFFAVYDGHYGFATSRYLKDVLIQAVYTDLLRLYDAHPPLAPPPSDEAVTATIAATFTRLDDDIISNIASTDHLHPPNPSTTVKCPHSRFDIATQGSCALLTFYDARSNRLFTACTGDSRAVLGKRVGSAASTRWLAKPLSVDQNFASNPAEVHRVRAEHPGEDGVITQNRLMGDLAVSRAFGDARFKARDTPTPPLQFPPPDTAASDGSGSEGSVDGSVDVHVPSLQSSIEEAGLLLRRMSTGTRSQIATPPYVTAEPVVSTYAAVRDGDFLILGSDGLWDFLSSEDAVALVGRWTDTHVNMQAGGNSSTGGGGKRQATRLTQSQMETFVFESDENAGVHLLRNALGGARQGRLLFTLGLPPGREAAKRHRDDITVIVVFFAGSGGPL